MLKIITTSAILLMPILCNAQYIAGTYILNGNRLKIYSGNLKVRPNGLTVKDDAKNTSLIKPDDILYIKTADHKKYVVVGGFTAPGLNRNHQHYGNTIVELIDSGRVCLTRYNNLMPSNFTLNSASGVSDGSLYIIQSADSAMTLPLYAWTNKGKKLCDALVPYVNGRSDLQQLLDDRQIRNESVPAFFHALNTGQPFVKPE